MAFLPQHKGSSIGGSSHVWVNAILILTQPISEFMSATECIYHSAEKQTDQMNST